jgi:NAD(P)-dependent dehydrogenase (short-subunit alcohol dehydrogenase family)
MRRSTLKSRGRPAVSRIVLITGCSSGIGAACAARFAANGDTVYATARRAESLAALGGLGCRTRALDVTLPASIDRVVAEIEASHDGVDVLINNAGYGQQGAFEETSLDAFRAQLETNLIGAIAVTQRVLPGMRARRRGRILMMSSMGGRLSFPGGAAYHASKYALEAASDVLRFEVARFGIDVVIVEPGLVASRYGETSLARLAGGELHAYARFTAGLRAALTRSFTGEVEGASSPEEVATACFEAASASPAPTRVVVGAMAEKLIGLRARASDPDWDALLETMYPRPEPD